MHNTDMAKIHILNGPNLNMLGTREPEKYGKTTLADLNRQLEQQAQALGCDIQLLQSNAEHELVTKIQQAKSQGVDFIIINAAAFTHTSVAIRDALLAVAIPFIEVHISNVYARESFRHRSYLSDVAVGVICGLGVQGYQFALQAADHYLKNHNITEGESG